MATTKQMTEIELAQIVGAGPYTLVRASKDVLRDGLSPSCELCRSAIVKGLVFSASTGREFVVGCDCARWIPGKRRSVSMAIADMERELKAGRKPKVEPHLHTRFDKHGRHLGWRLHCVDGSTLEATPDHEWRGSEVKRIVLHRAALSDGTTLEASTSEGLEAMLRSRVDSRG